VLVGLVKIVTVTSVSPQIDDFYLNQEIFQNQTCAFKHSHHVRPHLYVFMYAYVYASGAHVYVRMYVCIVIGGSYHFTILVGGLSPPSKIK